MRKSGKQIETRQEESEDIVISDNYDDDTDYTHILDETQKREVDKLLHSFTQQMEEYFEYKAEEKLAEILMKITSLVYSDFREKREDYKRQHNKS